MLGTGQDGDGGGGNALPPQQTTPATAEQMRELRDRLKAYMKRNNKSVQDLVILFDPKKTNSDWQKAETPTNIYAVLRYECGHDVLSAKMYTRMNNYLTHYEQKQADQAAARAAARVAQQQAEQQAQAAAAAQLAQAQAAAQAAEAQRTQAEAQIIQLSTRVEELQIREQEAQARAAEAQAQAGHRLKGIVEWWDNKKKCGVIIRLNGDKIFCHISNLNDGNALEPDSEVEFAIEFNAQNNRDEAVRVTGAISR